MKPVRKTSKTQSTAPARRAAETAGKCEPLIIYPVEVSLVHLMQFFRPTSEVNSYQGLRASPCPMTNPSIPGGPARTRT